MPDPALADRIAQLDDEELLRMLTHHIGQYREEAIALGRGEAERRGLALTPPPEPEHERSLFEAGREALHAAKEALGPSAFSAAGKKIACSHCGSELFTETQALLKTRLRTFFKFDWLDRSGTALICSECSLIQGFAAPPERL